MSPTLFQLTDTPIKKGSTLIEASAGTGKTYTISGLFLRLLIEERLSVRDILVVTFTEAATEELRDRIRQLLARAKQVFTTGRDDPKFPCLKTLFERHQSQRQRIVADLDSALCGFDEAPIFTIHGFCQRTLKDKAFESGELFDLELVTDQTALLQEVADDYWRKRFYEAGPTVVNVAMAKNFSPETFLPLLKSCIRYPSLRLLAPGGGQSVAQRAAQLESLFAQLRHAWACESESIKACFGSSAKWANKPYNRDDEMALRFAELESCFALSAFAWEFLSCLEHFCPEALAAAKSKNSKQPAPSHRFFDLCHAFCKGQVEFAGALLADFHEFTRTELPRRKQQLKVQSFDDLLTRLDNALHGPGGGALVAGMRKIYRAALIDEFQDTDPVQYQIFKRVFGSGDHWLFLIGDPKQAIYGFRGADIFTYMKASAAADGRFTLGENWRSETGLVHAVNTVFDHMKNPFVFEAIEFHPVQAKGEADREPLTIAGEAEAPMELWFWRRSPDGRPISKTRAGERLPGVVASEIARLLHSNTRLGERTLRPQDIAVLVLKNEQARQVQQALHHLNIPSVLQTTESLFQTHEAAEVGRVLAAIAQPANECLLRAALSTDMLGLNAGALERLGQDETAWQDQIKSFHDYLDAWTHFGFIQMFRQLLHREEVRSRLLQFPDGERRLTNVLHLGEVLHQACVENRLGVAGLLKWLAQHQKSDAQTADEYQLRLERDDNAVQLVTVHRSKGLEYEIVFCPFSWRDSNIKNWQTNQEEAFFHSQDNDAVLSRDLGTDDFELHCQIARKERLAESVRLLYVALTRARHRCYLVWGAINEAGTSAPAWIFHQPEDLSAGIIPALKELFKERDDETMLGDLRRLAASSRDKSGRETIRVTDLPNEPGEVFRPEKVRAVELEPRAFSGTIPRDWRITSFSSLTSGHEADLPDRDSAAGETPPVLRVAAADSGEACGIFAFPRGARPGTCLHEIFESLDFTESDPGAIEMLVAEKLRAHGFRERGHVAAVREAVARTLRIPLDPARPDFTLSGISRPERITELEFHFPLTKVSPERLRKAFQAARGGLPREFPERLERLTFSPVAGCMKGFIDLVFRFEERFYIVDWKSNWLGNQSEHYAPEPLRAAMAGHCYFLQYHLYTLALDRYLSLRLPDYSYEEHFGGVFYLFLRGIDLNHPECGIYRDRPSADFIEELREVLWQPVNTP